MELFEAIVRRAGRPGLRDHRGRTSLHQPAGGRRSRRLRRSSVLAVGRRVSAARRGRAGARNCSWRDRSIRGRLVLGVLHVPWRRLPRPARSRRLVHNRRHRFDSTRRGPLPRRPNKGGDLRRRTEVLPGRGRGVHQPLPGVRESRVFGASRAARGGAIRGGGAERRHDRPGRPEGPLRDMAFALQGAAGVRACGCSGVHAQQETLERPCHEKHGGRRRAVWMRPWQSRSRMLCYMTDSARVANDLEGSPGPTR